MRGSFVTLSAFAGMILGATALIGAKHASSFEVRETARLRAHFDSVLVELRSRDVSALRPEQRAARAVQIARLQEYRDAGVFPRNLVSRDATPVFVDPFGTHCAMGYLIARSGRSDIVGRIASTRNLARIPELADDRALIAWLDSAGLSVTEAARIQPTYGGKGGCCTISDPMAKPSWPTTTEGYEVSSFVYAGLAGMITAANLIAPGRTRWTLAGTAVGAAGIGLAASQLSNSNARTSYVAANGLLAAASIGSAWRSARIARQMAATPRSNGTVPTASVSPLVSPSAVGVSISFR
jgi:hypothetical protein